MPLALLMLTMDISETDTSSTWERAVKLNPVQRQVARHVMAQAESRGTSVAFTVARLEKIKSDGRPHKTTIAIEKFKPETEYFATPKASSNAYLSAKVTNNTDKPLLPGKMNIFVGGDFVGASYTKFVAQNEEFQILISSAWKRFPGMIA